jgi:hypothetical protein
MAPLAHATAAPRRSNSKLAVWAGFGGKRPRTGHKKIRDAMIFKSIRDRLGNWSAWSRGGTRHGSGCSTAEVCDSLRRAALGDISQGFGGGQRVDLADGELVERAWTKLAPQHKEMLRWHYLRNAPPGLICRRLGIKPRPTSIFDIELKRAETAIEKALLARPPAP